MSYILIILTTAISIVGIFFSKSGSAQQVSKIGYGILSLILIVGSLSLLNVYQTNKSKFKQEVELKRNFSAAQLQLILQRLDLAGKLNSFEYSNSIQTKFPEERTIKNIPFETASATPFFRNRGIGEELGFISIEIGEDVERRLDFVQHPKGMLVKQAVGSGELADKEQYISFYDGCEYETEGKDCAFVYAGGSAVWRESGIIGIEGQNIDLSTDVSAASIIASILNSGRLGSIKVIDAFKDKWWWQKRSIEAFYMKRTNHSLIFTQNIPKASKGERCFYSFVQNLKLELQNKTNSDDLEGYFLPEGPPKISFCKLPY